MKALAIDDDVIARESLKGLLDGAGIGFVWAADAAAGLRLFHSERPDLVVLNLELPGSSGWSALVTIRELSDLPIIGLSALDGEMDKVRGLRRGADDFMTKPVGRQEMLASAWGRSRSDADRVPPPRGIRGASRTGADPLPAAGDGLE